MTGKTLFDTPVSKEMPPLISGAAEPKSWSLASFLPPVSNAPAFGSLDPPPAHSGSAQRQSAIQRNPYPLEVPSLSRQENVYASTLETTIQQIQGMVASLSCACSHALKHACAHAHCLVFARP